MGSIYFASENRGKVAEVEALLEKAGIAVKGVSDLTTGDRELYAPVESGDTFIENARIKARELFQIVNEPVIADDSGLEVDVLGGRPGVHSSRYGADDQSRIDRLLKECKPFREGPVKARFVSAICHIDRFGNELFLSGSVEGEIIEERRGENGFGYDPVFYYPPQKKTFGELSRSEKEGVSHRGKALQLLVRFLEKTQAAKG